MAINGDLERNAVFAEEDFVVEAQLFLHALMEKKGASRSDLARAMGVSRARVTQIFSDECKNFTVRLLARAAHALGEAPLLTVKEEASSVGKAERSGDCWNMRVLDEDDLEKVWNIRSIFNDVKSLMPSNDIAPRCLTGFSYSSLEWEAA